MKVTIDRFEGDFAVVVKPDQTPMNIQRNKLPEDAKEGNILTIDGDNITIDAAETAKRKKAVHYLMNKLWKERKS